MRSIGFIQIFEIGMLFLYVVYVPHVPAGRQGSNTWTRKFSAKYRQFLRQ